MASVARGPSVCLDTTRLPGQSRSSRSSRNRCRRRHPNRHRRNSSRRNPPRQQGQGRQEGVGQEGYGRTPCALAGTTSPLAGAAGERGMAAIADSTGSAVMQGRPRGEKGERREEYLRRRTAPVPGSVSPALVHGENQLSRDKAGQCTAGRFKQSLDNHRGGRKKNAVTAATPQSFHSSRQNLHESEQQILSNQK